MEVNTLRVPECDDEVVNDYARKEWFIEGEEPNLTGDDIKED